MRIAIGSSSPPDRGAGINTYCKEISEELIRQGHEIYYLSPAPEDEEWFGCHGIKHLVLDQFQDSKTAVTTALKFIASNGVEAIINNDNAHLQNIAPFVDIPFISVCHLGESNILSLASFNWRWVDRIVAISNQMKSVLINRKKVPVHKVSIVYNGIQDPFSNSNIVEKASGKIIFNGGSNRRKGADLLFVAVQGKSDVWSQFTVEWFGSVSTKYRAVLESLPHVNLRGRVPRAEMVQALLQGDLFLLPSRKEGCPMAMIEAMAAGNICIASNGQGAMEVMVAHGIDGYIADLNDWPDQLLDILSQLSKNPAVVARMKRESRMRYKKAFHVALTVENLLQIISEPTVDRSSKPVAAPIVKWHRPEVGKTGKAPLLDRFRIRAGLLTSAGQYTLARPGAPE